MTTPRPDCPPDPAALLPTPDTGAQGLNSKEEVPWVIQRLQVIIDEHGAACEYWGTPRPTHFEAVAREVIGIVQRHTTPPALPVDVAETVERLKHILEDPYVDLNKKEKRITDAIGLIERLHRETHLKDDDVYQWKKRAINDAEYIKKLDGLIEEVGGITASCINPYEDLKRALLKLKEERDAKDVQLNEWENVIAELRTALATSRAEVERLTIWERDRTGQRDSAQAEADRIGQIALARWNEIVSLRAQLTAASADKADARRDSEILDHMDKWFGGRRVSWGYNAVTFAAHGCDERFTHATFRDAIKAKIAHGAAQSAPPAPGSSRGDGVKS